MGSTAFVREPRRRRLGVCALSALVACAPRAGSTPSANDRGAATSTAGAAALRDAASSAEPLVWPRLLFACVGDTRPADEDDAAGYPSDVIGAIYARIEGSSPRPPLVVSTGDYVYASEHDPAQAGLQLDLYLRARARYSGLLLPAMGNHECTGETIANCGASAPAGLTNNYVQFVQRVLAPMGLSEPYYAAFAEASDRSWTAKFVVIAANAWSSDQQAWLEATLARATTYTFVVRHEPAYVTEAPGVAPSESILSAAAYTLVLVGHDHTYGRTADRPREVIVGNGGAPLSSKDYGYALFSQRADGAVVVDMMSWRTGLPDPAFHFVVRPDGTVL